MKKTQKLQLGVNLQYIIIIYLPKTHTTQRARRTKLAYDRCDKAEVQH